MAEEERLLMIGRGLRLVRTNKEITQDVLAKLSGLSINFLSSVENGRKGVSQSVAERIAGALQVPTSFLYLLGDLSNEPLVRELQNAVLKSLLKSVDDSKEKENYMYGRQRVLN